ncbi:putative epoxide hydrolase [Nocardia brasiliensis NBRC 14402]|uniref:epoxide hydrolase family protein n=1 Tax=Nocardia brasiliensis TaxID=37326 RepID=UPI00045D4E4D|nr:epoxide hydrolase [Nocardia brasiliensis]ASF07731.1 epoxide hydrolase [Nocardia brasiliensis]GAJ82983.1 putative epoxide hydrolase [Nocardia brasiliensis NBRC 14402]SUB54701.1 Lipase 3 precursor [Nocardia brasiliensis]
MPGQSAAVVPFEVEIPESVVTDARERLRRTRWPEPETVGDWSQGTPAAYLRGLCRYWLDEYDWRAAQRRLNRFPQFVTEIDGLPVHFVHARSPHAGATALLITHGWPGSVTEFHKVVAPLTDPVAFGGNASDAFHVVCPSLPGFGFSGKPERTGWGAERIADAWDQLMHRLGYARYAAQGGDWGARITMALARRHPQQVLGIHLNMVPFRAPVDAEDLTEADRRAVAALAGHRAQGSAYAAIQATRPQSIGYGLTDSPAALAGWIIDKFQAWSDCAGDPGTVFTEDELLDNLLTYWLPATGASAARLYWESFAAATGDDSRITVPTGCSVFPADIYRPTRRLAEPQFADLRHWNELDRGGHFAALEQPAVFVDEVRATFRGLR